MTDKEVDECFYDLKNYPSPRRNFFVFLYDQYDHLFNLFFFGKTGAFDLALIKSIARREKYLKKVSKK